MKGDRPILVTYIADLNLLAAFLLIISLFPRQSFIITSSPTIFNVIIRGIVIIILLTISYGLLRVKRWSYCLMIAYNMVFLIVSIISLFTKQSFYFTNIIIPILGLTLTFSAKRHFIKNSSQQKIHNIHL